MADAANDALAELNDPRKYVRKEGVPLFRAHRRTLTDPKTGEQIERIVTEDDLPEIVAHMKAMESEGRLFRIGNGHIQPDGTEAEQPELLAVFKNARLGTFGPKRIPCVLVDEYAKADKLDTLKNRPYRSAEYYPQSKVITGAAALVRDPQLNLGAVLYMKDEKPWHYAEPIMPEPTATPAAGQYSPEETEMYEKMCGYLAQKFPQIFGANGPGLPGPTNAFPPTDKDQPNMNAKTESPELYELRGLLAAEKKARDSQQAELDKLKREREEEKVDRLLDQLEKIEKYELDRAETREEMLRADETGRQKIAARIRKYHDQMPGGAEPIEVYSGKVEGGASAKTTEEQHEKAVRLATTEKIDYDAALARVKTGK